VRELRSLQAVLDGELITPDSAAYEAVRRDVTRARLRAPHRHPRRAPWGRPLLRGPIVDDGPGPRPEPPRHRRRPPRRSREDRRGARLAQVYDGLHRFRRTLPAGCGPTVGIAGLTLGGGLGLLGRRHGLTCDALRGTRVALADGRVVDCDRHREPELFWALRGAGGGQFGVVTSLVFATIAEPRATRFELRWPEAAAVDVVAGWQDWAAEAPDDVTANLTLVAEPRRPLGVAVLGAALRPAENTIALLASLAVGVGVEPEISHDVLAWRDLKRSFAGDEQPDAGPVAVARSSSPARCRRRRSWRWSTSSPREQPRAVASSTSQPWVARTTACRRTRPHSSTAASGSCSSTSPTAGTRGSTGRGRSRVLASRRVYPNFPDPGLDDWSSAYHGGNAEQLRAVKRSHDPERLFRFPRAI
jgi:hypothetical protein